MCVAMDSILWLGVFKGELYVSVSGCMYDMTCVLGYSGSWGFVLVYQFVSSMVIIVMFSSCSCAASLA
jgi:ABC-type uncharacterized transport system involved in gliding motility auxiliary subunit